jgi:hypothetical protein
MEQDDDRMHKIVMEIIQWDSETGTAEVLLNLQHELHDLTLNSCMCIESHAFECAAEYQERVTLANHPDYDIETCDFLGNCIISKWNDGIPEYFVMHINDIETIIKQENNC